MTDRNHYYYAFAGVLLFLLAFALSMLGASEELRQWISAEGGPVDLPSGIGYLVCAGLSAALAKEARKRWYVIVLLVAMGLREFDCHKRFTAMTITKAKFWRSDAPDSLQTKVIVAMLFMVLFASLCLLLARHGRAFWEELKRKEPWAIGVLLAAGLAVFTKLIDGLPRKLDGIGIRLGHATDTFGDCAEEIFELGIPLMLVLAILAGVRRNREARAP